MGRRRSHAIATLALAGAATLILGTAPALAIATVPAPAQPDFDARSGDRAAVPAATADAREALAKDLGAQAVIAADPVTGGLRSVARTGGLLTGPSTADPATVAIDYVHANADAFGLDRADLATLKPVDRNVSPDGVTHLTFGQLDGGIGAYDSALTANVTADGRLINAGGAPVHDLQPPSTNPPLGPAAARAAARRDLGLPPDGQTGIVGTDPARTTQFGGLDRASLVTLADPDGDHLAWKLTVAGDGPYVYEVLVDAASGAILTRHSLTDFASNASVVEGHPGDGSLHTVDLAAWLTPPVAALTGPNVHAYPDRSEPDGIGGVGDSDTEVGPNPSTTNFNYPTVNESGHVAVGQHCPTAVSTICTWDGTTVDSPWVTQNVDQVTTQVFYYVNKFHDWLEQAPIGFTPASYNFEVGGPGGDDPLDAETDDFDAINNADMVTPPDGQPGRMQMYLFKYPFPAVNGGDDASIVYHEYTHGLTNRLVGNDGQANGLLDRQSQAMGEGWSDWYALDFLTAQGLLPDTATPGEQLIGAYVTDDTTTGIRENAVDCPVGAVSASCPGTAPAGPGGFTYADLGRVDGTAGHPDFEVHADGEIWSETLWDLRRSVGATVARGLITGALRLAPKQPTFLDMRDAILLADTATGGTHRAQIWSVFAARGMGYSASTTSANATHATAAFDTPPLVAAGAPDATSAALEQDTVLHVPIVNPSTTPLTGVRATLSATTTGVTVPASGAVLGTIGAGATATATFAIHVAAAAGCGAVAGLSLAVVTDQGPRTIPLGLPVGTGSATAATRSYAPPVAIPDNQPAGGLTSTLTVPTHGRVGNAARDDRGDAPVDRRPARVADVAGGDDRRPLRAAGRRQLHVVLAGQPRTDGAARPRRRGHAPDPGAQQRQRERRRRTAPERAARALRRRGSRRHVDAAHHRRLQQGRRHVDLVVAGDLRAGVRGHRRPDRPDRRRRHVPRAGRSWRGRDDRGVRAGLDRRLRSPIARDRADHRRRPAEHRPHDRRADRRRDLPRARDRAAQQHRRRGRRRPDVRGRCRPAARQPRSQPARRPTGTRDARCARATGRAEGAQGHHEGPDAHGTAGPQGTAGALAHRHADQGPRHDQGRLRQDERRKRIVHRADRGPRQGDDQGHQQGPFAAAQARRDQDQGDRPHRRDDAERKPHDQAL